MAELKFELKKVKLFRGMEGYGLNADLYINGVKCMLVIDSGDGGCMDFEEEDSPEAKALIKAMDKYIKTLPPLSNRLYPVERESFINALLVKQDEAKNKAKREKKMNALYTHAIVIGKPNENGIRFMDFKQPLSKVGKTRLQFYVSKLIHDECHDGTKVLNPNLQELGILVK